MAGLGVKILVTELDARDTDVSGSFSRRDRIVADAYAEFLDVVLDLEATEAILLWGFTDRHSWLTGHFPRRDGDLVRGLPYDDDYRMKLAWYAVASALDNAKARLNPSQLRRVQRQ